MNLYNPSELGEFVFDKQENMTDEIFDANFEQSLLKPTWKYYHDYLS